MGNKNLLAVSDKWSERNVGGHATIAMGKPVFSFYRATLSIWHCSEVHYTQYVQLQENIRAS